MNQREYLDLLSYYLRSLPKNIINDIVFDYEEHFRFGLESGKTEEQISEELGPPVLIAKQFLEGEGINNPGGESIKVEPKKGMTTFGKILLVLTIVLLSPFILTVLAMLAAMAIGIVATVIGLVAGFAGLLVLGIAILVSVIPGFVLPAFISVPYVLVALNPFTKVALGIGVISLSIGLILSCIKLIGWIFISIKKLALSIKWRWNKRGNRNED